jgi:hypothetical protein
VTLTSDDVAEELVRIGVAQGRVLEAALRSEGIESALIEPGPYLGSPHLADGLRVMVRRRDLTRVRVVLDEFERSGGGAVVSDEELAALAEQSAQTADPDTGATV